MEPDVVPVREIDAKGILVRSGAKWIEPSYEMGQLGMFVAVGGMIGLILGVVFAFVAGFRDIEIFIGWWVITGLVAWAGFRMSNVSAKRSAIFESGGVIRVANDRRRGSPNFRMQDVGSIEVKRSEGRWAVAGISKGGRTYIFSAFDTEEAALEVSVQLTQAITQLREAMGTRAEKPSVTPKAQDGGPQLID